MEIKQCNKLLLSGTEVVEGNREGMKSFSKQVGVCGCWGQGTTQEGAFTHIIKFSIHSPYTLGAVWEHENVRGDKMWMRNDEKKWKFAICIKLNHYSVRNY